MPIYVAGGEYLIDGWREFRCVRPSHIDLPYITEEQRLHLTAHHAHLYEYRNNPPDPPVLIFVMYGKVPNYDREDPKHVLAPARVDLSKPGFQELQKQIELAIKKGVYCRL